MYSLNEYTSDGLTAVYSFSFEGEYPGYLEEDHIKVYFDDTLQDTGAWTLTTPTSVTLDPVPASGVVLKIARESDITSTDVNFSSGALLTEANLDLSNTQLLYLIQELSDRITKLESS